MVSMPGQPPDEATRRRRWRLFLTAEGGLLLVALAATWAALMFHPAPWVAIPPSILWTWLAFTLPICFLYLIGRPPVMTLSPLIPSAESRAFGRELAGRPVLTDDEFYARFYEGSGIPKDIPARVRRCLCGYDPLAGGVLPSDRLWLPDDDLDLADVLHAAGRACGLRFTRADYPAVDGALDNLVRLVNARRGQGTAPHRPDGGRPG